MKVDDIVRRREEGYWWSIGDGKAVLRFRGKVIVRRKMTKKAIAMALTLGIDSVCFGLFGENGRDRVQFRMLAEKEII